MLTLFTWYGILTVPGERGMNTMKNVTIEQYDLEKQAIKRNREKLSITLTNFSRKWLKENYNVTLTHDIKINARLKRAMGRVTYNTHGIVKIELSESIILDYRLSGDSTNMIGTLKHELIHYALYKLNLPFKDNDKYFMNECKKHNAPLSVNSIIESIHHYKCSEGHSITRKRKFNVKNYNCACGANLKYTGRKIRK